MQYISETSVQALLGKEWLVKTNSATSTPYLFKFLSSTIDLTCCILFTDTKSIWVEEMSSQQIARRWRECNPNSPTQYENPEDEDEWRTGILEVLTIAHSMGGIDQVSFELVDTNFTDIAFTFEWESFKWRWETYFIGHKISAEIISKHLIFPLISTSHLFFSSTDAVHNMSDIDVEKAVDKMGRTARRAVDTHIKNALSKPRMSTIIRRVTAVFNSLHELPNISSSVGSPDLQVPVIMGRPSTPPPPQVKKKLTLTRRSVNDSVASPQVRVTVSPLSQPPSPPLPPALSSPIASRHSSITEAESATESSAAEDVDGDKPQTKSSLPVLTGRHSSPERLSPIPSSTSMKRSFSPPQAPTSTSATINTSQSHSQPNIPDVIVPDDETSEDDSSPLRPPPKKVKPSPQDSSEDEDSEAERRARIARLKASGSTNVNANVAGGSSTGVRRGSGVRQPLKRGGKRF